VDAEYKLARGIQPALLNATLELIYPKNTSFTGVLENIDPVLRSIGQIHLEDETARLVFVYPKENDLVQDVCCLIEGLGKRAGAMGAHFLLAATEENNRFHYALCQCAYRPLFSQKYWLINLSREMSANPDYQWQPSTARDLPAIQSFYHTCLSPAIQTIMPIKPHNYPDALLYSNGKLCGLTSLHRFADTVFIYPQLFPSLPQPEKALTSLIKYSQPSPRVFLVIPSFQSWLEGLQAKLFAETILKQLILVKHFTLRQRATVEVEDRLSIKEHRREPTTSVTPSITREKY
jgi:hypothetical protein